MNKPLSYTLYRAVMNVYLNHDPARLSVCTKVLEWAVKNLVTIWQAITGIHFPRRVVGGWWWTWRLRLEWLAGWYDYPAIQYCRKFIRPGMTVVDIGAHVGYYTCLFSRLVGKTGKVIAYEASPENFPLLVHNIGVKHLRNVWPVRAAVCDENGPVKFYISPGNSNHSLVKGYTEAEAVIEVAGTMLDHSLAELGLEQVDFIKIDAEGAEPAILRGMERTLANSKMVALVVEMNPVALKAGGRYPADLIEALSGYGLRSGIILDDGGLSQQLPPDFNETVNLLCLREPYWKELQSG